MDTASILNLNASKTEKIRLLLQAGLTRKQVAELMGVGYGFVQNVFAATFPEQVRPKNRTSQPASILTFSRKFGVEIEAYGVEIPVLIDALIDAGLNAAFEGYTHTTTPHWKVVTDSSIRGTDTFELVSPVLHGENGLAQVEKACRVLESLGARVNKSCGMHVHFDAENMGCQTMRRVVLNYIALETTIDGFMPESRRGTQNRYCHSNACGVAALNAAGDHINRLMSAYGSRFHKVNLNSYLRHKTIEFRQHSGTVEFEKIKNWVLFLDGLTNFSATQCPETLSLQALETFVRPEVLAYLRRRTQTLNRNAA